MNIQDLIDELQKIEDKSILVIGYNRRNKFYEELTTATIINVPISCKNGDIQLNANGLIIRKPFKRVSTNEKIKY